MNGLLFKYGPGSSHLAFKTPAKAKHPRGDCHLVLVGGLTDGLLFAPYASKLAEAVGGLGWSLVQAQLTSSYQGWGCASLDQDAAELKLLSDCLKSQHNSQAWVLMGHSTGCQDAIRYVSRYKQQDSRLSGVILQAPVSDREYLSMFPSWIEKVPLAQQMVDQGRREDVVFRIMEWDGAAMTARRLLSLCCCGGDDDMFSTDLSLQQLQSILGHMQHTPCLILQSGADEAVPEQLRQSGAVEQLGHRMLKAMQLGALPSNSSEGLTAQAAEAQEAAGVHSTGSGAVSAEAAARDNAGGCAGSGRNDGGVLQQLQVIEGAGHACAGHVDEVVSAVSNFLKLLPLQQQQQQP